MINFLRGVFVRTSTRFAIMKLSFFLTLLSLFLDRLETVFQFFFQPLYHGTPVYHELSRYHRFTRCAFRIYQFLYVCSRTLLLPINFVSLYRHWVKPPACDHTSLYTFNAESAFLLPQGGLRRLHRRVAEVRQHSPPYLLLCIG